MDSHSFRDPSKGPGPFVRRTDLAGLPPPPLPVSPSDQAETGVRCRIRNTTGGTLPAFSVLQLGNALIPPTANASEYQRLPSYEGSACDDSHTARLAITQVPLVSAGIGLAVHAGATAVRLIGPSGRKYATTVSGELTLTAADHGPCLILFDPGSADEGSPEAERIAWVRIGAAPPVAYLARVPCGEYIAAAAGSVPGERVCCLFTLSRDGGGGHIAQLLDAADEPVRAIVSNPWPTPLGDGCYLPVVWVEGRGSGVHWIVTAPDCPVSEGNPIVHPEGYCVYEARSVTQDGIALSQWVPVTEACAADQQCVSPTTRVTQAMIAAHERVNTNCEPRAATTEATSGAIPGTCCGRIKWSWSADLGIWEQIDGECTDCATTTSVATTTGDGSSTTTTATTTSDATTTSSDCLCPALTTTAEPTTTGDGSSTTTTATTTSDATTTTAQTRCHPVYPSFCGSEDGECTWTRCTALEQPTPPAECSTTSEATTTSDSSTTGEGSTTCDCASVETALGPCDCWIEWECHATGWGKFDAGGDCSGRYCCKASPPAMEDCNTATCGTRVTTHAARCRPGSPPACSGMCVWIGDFDGRWIPEPWGQCSGGEFGCYCERPAEPPEECGQIATTRCAAKRRKCYRECIPTTTAESSTTADRYQICEGTCRVRFFPGGYDSSPFWATIESDCPEDCPCQLPTDTPDCVEIRESYCAHVPGDPGTTSDASTTDAPRSLFSCCTNTLAEPHIWTCGEVLLHDCSECAGNNESQCVPGSHCDDLCGVTGTCCAPQADPPYDDRCWNWTYAECQAHGGTWYKGSGNCEVNCPLA